MTEHIENTKTSEKGILSRRASGREESLRRARECLEFFRETRDFQWRGILLSHLEDAGAKPEDIGTTMKDINILMLRTHLYYAQWALDIIKKLAGGNCSYTDIFRLRILQAGNFAYRNATTLVELKEPFKPIKHSGFENELDVLAKESAIQALEEMLARARESLNAIAASGSAKNLEEFLAILDAASKLAEKNQQILCGSG